MGSLHIIKKPVPVRWYHILYKKGKIVVQNLVNCVTYISWGLLALCFLLLAGLTFYIYYKSCYTLNFSYRKVWVKLLAPRFAVGYFTSYYDTLLLTCYFICDFVLLTKLIEFMYCLYIWHVGLKIGLYVQAFFTNKFLIYWLAYTYKLDYTLVLLYCIVGFIVWLLVKTISIRLKFLSFFFLICWAGIFGFYYNFDGIIFILLLTEFTLLFVFLLLFTRLTISVEVKHLPALTFIYCLILSLVFYYVFFQQPLLFTMVKTIYSIFTTYIISSDFFIFFYFFFYSYPLLVVLLAVLLGLFSIFFIFIYFNIKVLGLVTYQKTLTTKILRKQQLVHQSAYIPSLRTFQQ